MAKGGGTEASAKRQAAYFDDRLLDISDSNAYLPVLTRLVIGWFVICHLVTRLTPYFAAC